MTNYTNLYDSLTQMRGEIEYLYRKVCDFSDRARGHFGECSFFGQEMGETLRSVTAALKDAADEAQNAIDTLELEADE